MVFRARFFLTSLLDWLWGAGGGWARDSPLLCSFFFGVCSEKMYTDPEYNVKKWQAQGKGNEGARERVSERGKRKMSAMVCCTQRRHATERSEEIRRRKEKSTFDILQITYTLASASAARHDGRRRCTLMGNSAAAGTGKFIENL